MKVFRRASLLAIAAALLLLPRLLGNDWRSIEQGVYYREYIRDGLHAYVARIDLRQERLRILATDEADKGMTVGDFAEKHGAAVAINADYFDEQMRPVGPSRGPSGPWAERHGSRNQPVIGFGSGRAEIFRPGSRDDPLPDWVEQAVSGWPMLVEECAALGSEQLPGSDFFTRAPHPRTAVGLSGDGNTLYLVITDGRRAGVPGPTLEELGAFMREELEVCSALNLDGGGSSAMALEGKIVNQPSDGVERVVANHLAVVVDRGAVSPPAAPRETATKE